MKRLILATLGFGGLAIGFAVVGWLAALNIDYILGRFPGSMRVVSERFNLLSAYKGYVSQAGVYQTDGEVLTVWRWYAKHLGVEPEEGMGMEGECVRLTNATQLTWIRRTVVVRLCPARHGTQVFATQSVSFAYPMSAGNFSRSP